MRPSVGGMPAPQRRRRSDEDPRHPGRGFRHVPVSRRAEASPWADGTRWSACPADPRARASRGRKRRGSAGAAAHGGRVPSAPGALRQRRLEPRPRVPRVFGTGPAPGSSRSHPHAMRSGSTRHARPATCRSLPTRPQAAGACSTVPRPRPWVSHWEYDSSWQVLRIGSGHRMTDVLVGPAGRPRNPWTTRSMLTPELAAALMAERDRDIRDAARARRLSARPSVASRARARLAAALHPADVHTPSRAPRALGRELGEAVSVISARSGDTHGQDAC